jgi:pilus assembly protein CpaF
VDEIGVVRRSGEMVVVEPGWRADSGPCPARDRMEELRAGEQGPGW